MKKTIAIVSVIGIAGLVGCSTKEATAATIDLMVGKDRAAQVAVTGVNIGKDYGKFNVSAQVNHAINNYTTYGAGVEYTAATFAGANLGVSGAVALVDPRVGSNGYIASYGVFATHPLSKTVSVKAAYARTEDLNDAAGMKGHGVMVGLTTSF